MWINNKINFCKIYLYKNDDYKIFPIERLTKFTSPNYFNQVNDLKYGESKEFGVYYNDSLQIILLQRIVIIFSNEFIKDSIKAHHINKNFDSILKPINLTDKNIIKKYLNKITDNIIEVTISQENHFNYFDTPHLYGSKIQFSEEFETIMDNEDLFITIIKFQLLGNSTIKIRDKNILEFSEGTNEQDKLVFLNTLGQILK